MKKSVYALVYEDANDDTIVFYIGCTNDVARRSAEHRRNSLNETHTEYNTYKYQWIRQLDQHDCAFRLEVIAEDVQDDENTEYEYVLKFARYNESQGYGFYEGMPLTNMRAGDFLSEMMRDRTVNTAAEIGVWRRRRTESQRVTAYERESQDISQGRDQRRNVANSMVIITQQKRTEEVLKQLAAQQRRQRREQAVAQARAEQRAAWEQTGKILGDDKK
jgi:predicted GIY-YIG superfamily endonuclease